MHKFTEFRKSLKERNDDDDMLLDSMVEMAKNPQKHKNDIPFKMAMDAIEMVLIDEKFDQYNIPQEIVDDEDGEYSLEDIASMLPEDTLYEIFSDYVEEYGDQY